MLTHLPSVIYHQAVSAWILVLETPQQIITLNHAFQHVFIRNAVFRIQIRLRNEQVGAFEAWLAPPTTHLSQQPPTLP